jgi:hypothetical protein
VDAFGPLATRQLPPKLSHVLDDAPGPTHATPKATHNARHDTMTVRPRFNDTSGRMTAHYAQ